MAPEEAEAYLNYLTVRARMLVRCRWRLVHELATKLMEERVMTGRRVREVIREAALLPPLDPPNLPRKAERTRDGEATWLAEQLEDFASALELHPRTSRSFTTPPSGCAARV
jgi:hypothetical protein